MSASRAPYLNDWRFSMTLVPKNLTQDCQDPGKTFRGPNARVENGLGRNCNDSNTAFNRGGTAKPGPTTDSSSRIARIKKLQTHYSKIAYLIPIAPRSGVVRIIFVFVGYVLVSFILVTTAFTDVVLRLAGCR